MSLVAAPTGPSPIVLSRDVVISASNIALAAPALEHARLGTTWSLSSSTDREAFEVYISG